MDPDLSAMNPRTRRLINGVMAVVVLAIVATIVVGVLTSRPKGLTFTIVLDNAQDIALGAPVSLRGLRIGEVTKVELNKSTGRIEVGVAVTPTYSDQIPDARYVTARIRKSLVLPGNQQVILVIQRGATGRMAQGARIEGVDTLAGEWTFRGKGVARQAYQKGMEKAANRMERVREWWAAKGGKDEAETSTPESVAARREIAGWVEEIEGLNEAENPKVRIRELREHAKTAQRKWRKEGLKEEARQVDEILAALDDYELAIKEDRE